MISVCIPVYNRDASGLVEQIHRQLLPAEVLSEIILVDDASSEEFRQVNRRIHPGRIKLIELDHNIGRARIRNRFLDYAQYPHLLFLDCDTEIRSPGFIQKYLDAIRLYPDTVICGGCRYDPVRPGRSRRLHWKYGIKRESRPSSCRGKHPNRSFMTANFLIPAHLLREIPFDERLEAYGHEDSLFGYRLEKMNKQVVHINNPVIHVGLATNREFLGRTDESLENLLAITGYVKNPAEFKRTIALLQYVTRLEKQGTLRGLLLLYHLAGPLVRFLLEKGFPNMHLLAFYKLGRYLHIRQKNKTKGIEKVG